MLHSLRKFIKKELNYWYKRGSSRSISSKESNCKYWQSIFSWRIIDSIYSGKIIINVDENVFSSLVKSNYSWLPWGESSWFLTPNHLSRWIVYFALWSSWEWMALISNNIENSNRFSVFYSYKKIYWINIKLKNIKSYSHTWYICFKILKLKTLYKLSIMLILLKIMIAKCCVGYN